MTSRGTYTILTSSSGKQEKIFMMTEQLAARLKALKDDKYRRFLESHAQRGKTPVTPRDFDTMAESAVSFSEIDKSHFVPFSSSFKPFMTAGQEYLFSRVGGGNPTFGSNCEFNIQEKGEFVSDMCIHVQITGARVKDPVNQVKYVDFIGHRIFPRVELQLFGQTIDSYTPSMANAFFDHEVPAGKKAAYMRAVGQESPVEADLVPNPATDNFRFKQSICTGYQTLKREQEVLDMWIPLWFWFKDVAQALPIGMLPMKYSKVIFTIAPRSSLIVMGLAHASEISGDALLNSSNGISGFEITTMELVANHIFIDPEILNLYVNKTWTYLCRLHTFHEQILTATSGSIKLQGLKWPTETLYIGFHPLINDAGSNDLNIDQGNAWYSNQFLTAEKVEVPVAVLNPLYNPNDVHSAQYQFGTNRCDYYSRKSVVDHVSIEAQNIVLLDADVGFYTDYISYRMGKDMDTTDHPDWLVAHFALTPGEFQPSGFINFSQNRETYLRYNTDRSEPFRQPKDLMSAQNPVRAQILGRALNFITVKPSGAALVYST